MRFKFVFLQIALTAVCLPVSPLAAQLTGALVINEFVASNDSTAGGYQEPDGGYGDWIELFNRSDRALDLTGVQVSDDRAELGKWTIPAGTNLAAGGYLIIWADEDLLQTGLHASFKLSKDGEDVVVSKDGTVIDAHTYGPQETNVSEARLPNGTGAFAKTRPTPSAFNSAAGVRDVAVVQVDLRPNPATDFVELRWTQETFNTYGLYDATGRCLSQGQLERGVQRLRLDTATLPAGTYQVTLDGGRGRASFVKG